MTREEAARWLAEVLLWVRREGNSTDGKIVLSNDIEAAFLALNHVDAYQPDTDGVIAQGRRDIASRVQNTQGPAATDPDRGKTFPMDDPPKCAVCGSPVPGNHNLGCEVNAPRDEDAERREFEAWWVSRGMYRPSRCWGPGYDGEYELEIAHNAWAAWQAARRRKP